MGMSNTIPIQPIPPEWTARGQAEAIEKEEEENKTNGPNPSPIQPPLFQHTPLGLSLELRKMKKRITCPICTQNRADQGHGEWLDTEFYCTPCLGKAVYFAKVFKRKREIKKLVKTQIKEKRMLKGNHEKFPEGSISWPHNSHTVTLSGDRHAAGIMFCVGERKIKITKLLIEYNKLRGKPSDMYKKKGK